MTHALVLAMLLTVSATVFAVDTFSEVWYAADNQTTVDASAKIEEHRTYGDIFSSGNQGEVYIEFYYTYYLYYPDNPFRSDIDFRSDTDWASVDSGVMEAYTMKNAYYTFHAYVPTDFGDSYYGPESVELEYPTWVN